MQPGRESKRSSIMSHETGCRLPGRARWKSKPDSTVVVARTERQENDRGQSQMLARRTKSTDDLGDS
jgi:hypothetical protein